MFEKEQKNISELKDRTIQSESNTDVLFKPKATEPSSPLISHWQPRMWKSRVEKWVLEEALNNSCARQRKWSPFMWAAEWDCQTLLIYRTSPTMHLNFRGMAADTNDLFSLMNEVWREPRVSALAVQTATEKVTYIYWKNYCQHLTFPARSESCRQHTYDVPMDTGEAALCQSALTALRGNSMSLCWLRVIKQSLLCPLCCVSTILR